MQSIRSLFGHKICRRWQRGFVYDGPSSSPKAPGRCVEIARCLASIAPVHPTPSPGEEAPPSRWRRRSRRRSPDGSIFAHCPLPQFEEASLEDIVRQLAESKVFDQDGIVGLNKPASLPVVDTVQGLPSLSKALPQLADRISRPSVEIAKAPDREASGLVLLGENKHMTKTLQEALIKAQRSDKLIRTYWALTLGVPSPEKGTIDLPLGPEKIGDQTLMVPSRHPTKGSFERKEVFRCRTDYRVLSANHELNCSLVELRPLKLKKHQFQVHLTDKLCCILGDRIYSGRIRQILGVPVSVEPHQAAIGTQTIPEAIQEALGLRVWHRPLLPLFLHWHQVSLPKWYLDRNVTITAPPPGYFTQALERLGLSDGAAMTTTR